MPPDVAVTVVEPMPEPVAKPCEPLTLLMVALVASEELQVAPAVTSCVVPSEKVPVAINCWVVPIKMAELPDDTLIEVSFLESPSLPSPPQLKRVKTPSRSIVPFVNAAPVFLGI
jgi:hypothetical protein